MHIGETELGKTSKCGKSWILFRYFLLIFFGDFREGLKRISEFSKVMGLFVRFSGI